MVVGGSVAGMKLAGSLEDPFEAHSYPTTTAELVESHGDVELALPNGAVTLGEALAHLPDEVLETPEEARLTTYGALGEDAIGRKGYSDRDPTSLGETGHEPVSL